MLVAFLQIKLTDSELVGTENEVIFNLHFLFNSSRIAKIQSQSLVTDSRLLLLFIKYRKLIAITSTILRDRNSSLCKTRAALNFTFSAQKIWEKLREPMNPLDSPRNKG